jgi:hypothetical protein
MNRKQRRRQYRLSKEDIAWFKKHAFMPCPPGHMGYAFEISEQPLHQVVVFGLPELIDRVAAKDDGTGNCERFLEKLRAEPELLSQLRFRAILGNRHLKMTVPGSAPDYEQKEAEGTASSRPSTN